MTRRRHSRASRTAHKAKFERLLDAVEELDAPS